MTEDGVIEEGDIKKLTERLLELVSEKALTAEHMSKIYHVLIEAAEEKHAEDTEQYVLKRIDGTI